MAVWSRLALVALLALRAAPVSAQGDAAEDARALFVRGMEHAENERWTEALEAFEASAERYDRVSTRLNVASVLLRLGRHIEARDRLRALGARGDIQPDEQRQSAALLERAEDGIRRVRLEVSPSDATIRIDGAPRAGEGATRELELDPGLHRAEIAADGHVSQTLDLAVGTRELRVHLEPRLAQVNVRSNVESAEVQLDGEVRGTGDVRLEMPAGRHRIVVSADDYEPFSRWIDPGPGSRLDVLASLALRQHGEQVYESPWFWVIGGAIVVLAAGLTIGLVLAFPSDPNYDGGTLDDVLMPQP
ncbi:MAG: PEGA domain-containing protein [Sandaracinaceae bacterium]